MACELIAQTKQPLSRQSVGDLTERAQNLLGEPISRTSVWRSLHDAAIKPWQFRHWLFPKDPDFEAKAGVVLDLYAGLWQGQPLGAKDYVLSSDEKTSIQARRRLHEEEPPGPEKVRRIEPEYERMGAYQYLAAWDVGRGFVTGRCEPKTGIASFGRLLDQILEQQPYRDAERLFVVVDNGSSHRGQASIDRAKARDPRLTLVHTPVHASWLNQVEVYFSMLQRKVLTPNDFADLDDLALRLRLYEEKTNQRRQPFCWKFTRQDMEQWLERAYPHLKTAKAV